MDTKIITPNIIRETSSGPFFLTIQEEMLEHREVECAGEINSESVYSLIRQLRHLQREDRTKEITMLINSPGGEVKSGLALYDVMEGLSCPIRTVCVGTAASMAAVLFAAGNRREILPHGKVMIHDPLIDSGAGGSALHVEEVSKRLLKTRQEICSILAERTGKTLKEIYKRTAKDTWFHAEEAVQFGLADRIITEI